MRLQPALIGKLLRKSNFRASTPNIKIGGGRRFSEVEKSRR